MATIKTLRKTGGDFTNTTQFRDWFVAQFPLSANVELHVQGGQHFGHTDTPDMDATVELLTFTTTATDKFNGYQLLITTDPLELSATALLDVKWEFTDTGNLPESAFDGLLKFDKLKLRAQGFDWDTTRLVTMWRNVYRTSTQITNCIIYWRTTSVESFDNIACLVRNYLSMAGDGDNSFIKNCHIILTRNNIESYSFFTPFDNYQLYVSGGDPKWGMMHNSVVTTFTDGTWNIELRHGGNYSNIFYNYGSGGYNITTAFSGSEAETITGSNPNFITSANQAINEFLSNIIPRDVRLLQSSPLIDSGGSEYSTPDDILGITRPIGDFPDRGAYEGFVEIIIPSIASYSCFARMRKQ